MGFGTGAGKGSLPRHVDGGKYRDNYDEIFKRKKPLPPTEQETTEVKHAPEAEESDES